MTRKPVHVALNGLFFGPGMGGMGTYLRGLVAELVRLAPEKRFSLWVSPATRDAFEGKAWTDGVVLRSLPWLGRRYSSAVTELWPLATVVERSGADVLHSLAMVGPLRPRLPHVVTVPDLIWWYHPESSGRLTTTLWRAIVPPVARRADEVLTISEASRAEILLRLGVAADRVHVTPCGPGAPPVERWPGPAELRERLDLGAGPVVLCVSAKRPHKNLLRLVDAMADVTRTLPNAVLVLTGAPTRHEADLRAAAKASGAEVRLLGWTTDEDLEGLYRLASCFVYPSLMEGFGLPVLEAMRRGVPVACGRASSLPEVAGDAAAYFDAHDAGDIARAVLGLLLDRPRAGELAVAGEERARAFTWTRTAELTLEAYDRARARARRR